jgi:hypothetical protein
MVEMPDTLSEWTLPPPAARESGDAEPIRCFDSAEAALRFLAGQDRQPGRRLMVETASSVRTKRALHRPRTCAVCGGSFEPRQSNARTCSSACRQRAYRERRAGPPHNPV